MLARHRQEHACHFWVFANIFIERLSNEVSQWHVVFSLATDLATVAAEAPSCIDKPTVLYTVIRYLARVKQINRFGSVSEAQI